jgi:hypothetical protein
MGRRKKNGNEVLRGAGMVLRKTVAGVVLMVLIAVASGCHKTKKHVEDADAARTYDQPAGPTSGLVKIIDTNTDDKDVWWYWFEFVDSDHLVKEYRVCNTDNDYIPKHMAGNISLQWQNTDNCFHIASFNRREDSEDK